MSVYGRFININTYIMQLRELVKTISTTIPEFTYCNSIAYEVSLETEHLIISYSKDGVVGIDCKKKIKITTDFIEDVVKLLENMLNNEQERNKTDWYEEQRYC